VGKSHGFRVASEFGKGIEGVFRHGTSSPYDEDSSLHIAAALHEFEVTRLPNHQMTWIYGHVLAILRQYAFYRYAFFSALSYTNLSILVLFPVFFLQFYKYSRQNTLRHPQ